MQRFSRRSATRIIAATGASLWSMFASAGLVTTHGHFESFSGPLAFPAGTPGAIAGFGPSLINGELVTPDAPSTRAGVGLVTSRAFAPGTTSVDFRNQFETPNRIEFTAAPAQDVQVGDEFLIGTFTLQNGDWWGGFGEGITLFRFSVVTSSADPALDGHVFTDSIRYDVTLGAPGNTAEDNADFFHFAGRPDLGTMRVYELFDHPPGVTNTGSIDLYGRIGSLVPTRLANARGGVFVGPRVMTPVPAPAAAGLLLAGVLGGSLLRRLR